MKAFIQWGGPAAVRRAVFYFPAPPRTCAPPLARREITGRKWRRARGTAATEETGQTGQIRPTGPTRPIPPPGDR